MGETARTNIQPYCPFGPSSAISALQGADGKKPENSCTQRQHLQTSLMATHTKAGPISKEMYEVL